VLYKNDNGCKWRALPKDFGPSWVTIYKFFSACQRKGIWEKVHEALRQECRRMADMPQSPSTARIDSQTGKSMLKKNEEVGSMVGTVFKSARQTRILPWRASTVECGSEHPPRHIVPTIEATMAEKK
jgi:hypothetical protein